MNLSSNIHTNMLKSQLPRVLFTLLFHCLSPLTCHNLETITSKVTNYFFTTNIQLQTKAQFVQSLGQFQTELLKTRNFACPDQLEAWKSSGSNWNGLDNVDKIVAGLEEVCWNSSELVSLLEIDDGELELNKTKQSLFEIVVTQLSNKGCALCLKDKHSTNTSQVTQSESIFKQRFIYC